MPSTNPKPTAEIATVVTNKASAPSRTENRVAEPQRNTRRALVNHVTERGTLRAGISASEGSGDRSVAGRGLEQRLDLAGVAASLEIEREAHVARPGMLSNEGRSSKQPNFFAIRK